jgi:NAD(P)-dependent dehydrogenase (short-subunit alcohol dehydrogenase family)
MIKRISSDCPRRTAGIGRGRTPSSSGRFSLDHRSPNQTGAEFPACAERVGAQVPMGRTGRPEEIAAAVLFLAGAGSSYMLGAEIIVDGGRAEL